MISANEMIPANPSVKSSHIGTSQKSPMASSKGSKFGMNDSEESSLSHDGKIFFQNLIQSFKETKGQTLESYKETKGQKIHILSRALSNKDQKDCENKCCALNNAQKSITDLLQKHLDTLTINPHFSGKTQNIHAKKCVRKILSHLSNAIKNNTYKNGSHNLTIDLNSENLGSLHINIKQEKNTLLINFSAETPAAQKMLVQNLAVLKSSLSKHLNQQIREDLKVPLNHHEITLQVMQGNNEKIGQNISLPFQNPHSSADDTSTLHHQKQGRRRRGRTASMTEINKENSETSSALKSRLSFSENEQDPKIFLTDRHSNEKQLFSQLPKATGKFDNLPNSAQKRSFTDYSGSIDHSGQVIAKENAGSQIALTKITLSPEELIQQTLPQLSAHIKNNGHHLIIDLQPEYLGKLHITLEMKENMLKANIITETQAVQKMLGENLALLKSSLADQGVQVEHFSVSVGEKGSEQNGGNKFADHSKKRGQKIKSINSPSLGALSEAEQIGGQNEDNGINYLA